MANVKITELTAYTNPDTTDVLPIVDVGADVTKKVSIENLLKNASSGTAAAPGIAFDGGNTGIYSPGADQVAISTNGAGRLFVDSSGKVGVGIASPGDYNSTVSQLSVGNTGGHGGINIVSNSANTGIIRFADGTVTNEQFRGSIEYNHSDDSLFIGTAGSEKLRIDSSGRLLVGTSSTPVAIESITPQLVSSTDGSLNGDVAIYSYRNAGGSGRQTIAPRLFFARSRSNTNGTIGGIVAVNEDIGNIRFAADDGTQFLTAAEILAEVDGTPGANDMPGRLVFSTTADGASSPTERMRISNNGQLDSFSTGAVYAFRTASAASASSILLLGLHSAAQNYTTGTSCFVVRTNGNVENTNNSYTGISDVKLKENIVDADSQWGDIKALHVRNYNFKPETGHQTHTQIGLVAQEVELVSPGLVSESPDRDAEGNDLGTVTKSVNYSVLYMKAVKALQEAMERIETLEAKIAALEAN